MTWVDADPRGSGGILYEYLSFAFVKPLIVWFLMIPAVSLRRSCMQTGHAGVVSALGTGAFLGLPFLIGGKIAVFLLALSYAALFWLLLRGMWPDLVGIPRENASGSGD